MRGGRTIAILGALVTIGVAILVLVVPVGGSPDGPCDTITEVGIEPFGQSECEIAVTAGAGAAALIAGVGVVALVIGCLAPGRLALAGWIAGLGTAFLLGGLVALWWFAAWYPTPSHWQPWENSRDVVGLVTAYSALFTLVLTVAATVAGRDRWSTS